MAETIQLDNPIFRIADRAAALPSSGVDGITLAAGEPEAATAAHIVEAAVVAARDPRTHHYGPAAGLPELRERIAARHPEHIGAGDVQVTVGTKHALPLALGYLTRAGNDVLVLQPSWPGHLGAVESVGGAVVDVPVDGQDLTSVAALEAACPPLTRAVVIANPSNPSGVLHPAELVADIAAWGVAKDVWLVSDEVYGAWCSTPNRSPRRPWWRTFTPGRCGRRRVQGACDDRVAGRVAPRPDRRRRNRTRSGLGHHQPRAGTHPARRPRRAHRSD